MGREVRSCCPGFLWQAGYERHKMKEHNVHWERRSLGVVVPDFDPSSTFPSGLGIFVLIGKESACCERPGFDPWFGKILWRRERLPTQCSGLENSMDYSWGVERVTKRRIQLSDFHLPT